MFGLTSKLTETFFLLPCRGGAGYWITFSIIRFPTVLLHRSRGIDFRDRREQIWLDGFCAWVFGTPLDSSAVQTLGSLESLQKFAINLPYL